MMGEEIWRKSVELWKRGQKLDPEEARFLDGWLQSLQNRKEQINQDNKKLDNAKKNFDGISVVIPVYNRAHLLDITLPTLYEKKFAGQLEIVVVDDRSTDNTEEVVERHNSKCGVIRYIKIKKGHIPKLNPEYIQHIQGSTDNIHINGNHAINVGVKRSKYDLILLTGAEIYHIANTLQMFYDKHRENNFDWLWIGSYGACEIAGDSYDKRELLRHAHEDFLNQKQVDEKWFEKWKFSCRYCENPHCVSFTKTPFYLIHGYDEDDYGWGWGDLEFNERMKNIGVRYINIPEPPNIMWVHLYHSLLELADGGTYNRLMAADKRLRNSPDDFFSIKGNMRNLNEWGILE